MYTYFFLCYTGQRQRKERGNLAKSRRCKTGNNCLILTIVIISYFRIFVHIIIRFNLNDFVCVIFTSIELKANIIHLLVCAFKFFIQLNAYCSLCPFYLCKHCWKYLLPIPYNALLEIKQILNFLINICPYNLW